MMVYFQSTPATSVGSSLWIRSCGGGHYSKRATVRLGIDTLIANILVCEILLALNGISCVCKRFSNAMVRFE